MSPQRGDQGGVTFTVRITARSARARLDGDLFADLDEAQLLERVVTPLRKGLPITLGGRRLAGDDIVAVRIVRLGERAEDVTDRYLGAPEEVPEGPKPVEGREGEKKNGADEIPSRLTVLVGVLTFAGVVITIAAAPAWLAAAAIAAALATCALHRVVWRPRPALWGVLAVVVITVVGGVGAHFAFESGSGREARPETTVESAPRFRSVGQIEGGDIVRASASGASGTYSDPLPAVIGSTVTVAIRLSNGGPDELFGTRVSAGLPSDPASALSIVLIARPRNANPPTVADTATIEIEGGGNACIAYVPGSTRLYDQHLGLIRALSDGTAGDGVAIGSLGVPIEDTRFVGLEVRLDRPQADSSEGSCG